MLHQLDPNLAVFLVALVAVAAFSIVSVGLVAWVCVGTVERLSERTADRLQARSLEEFEQRRRGDRRWAEQAGGYCDDPPAPYDVGPDAEVERMAGIASGGDPDALGKARRWNNHFGQINQQFTYGFGPGVGPPPVPPTVGVDEVP